MSRKKTPAIKRDWSVYECKTPHGLMCEEGYRIRSSLMYVVSLPIAKAKQFLLEFTHEQIQDILTNRLDHDIAIEHWNIDQFSTYTEYKRYHDNVNISVNISTNNTIINHHTRQRIATRWRQLIDWYTTYQLSDDHASQVVETSSLTEEDVHGGDEVAQDIKDAPKRDVAGQDGNQNEGEGTTGTTGEEGEGDSQQGKENGGSDGQGEQGEGATGGDGKGQGGKDHGQGADGKTSENIGAGGDQESGLGTSAQPNDLFQSLQNHLKEETDSDFNHYELSPESIQRGGYGGGGHRSKDGEIDPSLFYAMRQIIQMLANDPDTLEQQEGEELWDTRRLIRGRVDPQAIQTARCLDDSVTHDNLFLVVDNSGSVWHLAKVFTSLVASAAGIIRVFRGSEAHPNEELSLHEPLRSPNVEPQWQVSWTQEYQHSFADNLESWIKAVHPRSGARIIFWGDAIDMNLPDEQIDRVRHLLASYHPVWLMSHDGHNSYHGYEGKQVEKCMPVKYSIDSAVALVRATKTIK